MANCQNPMRYGRQTPMYTQRSTCNTCGSVRQNPRPVQQECPRPQESQVTRPFSDCRERIDRVEHRPENCKVHVHKEHHCHCSKDPLWEMPLAMAYVPWQRWQEIYDVCDGFQRGTIFRELDKPFHGKGGCNR